MPAATRSHQARPRTAGHARRRALESAIAGAVDQELVDQSAVDETAAAPGRNTTGAAAPAIELSEFEALRAISNYAYPNRAGILAAIGEGYIARGLAFRIGHRNDWSLSEAGWQRLNALKAERDAARSAPDPEIVDGALQCRLPIDDDEIELAVLQPQRAGDPGEPGAERKHRSTCRCFLHQEGLLNDCTINHDADACERRQF